MREAACHSGHLVIHLLVSVDISVQTEFTANKVGGVA